MYIYICIVGADAGQCYSLVDDISGVGHLHSLKTPVVMVQVLSAEYAPCYDVSSWE